MASECIPNFSLAAVISIYIHFRLQLIKVDKNWAILENLFPRMLHFNSVELAEGISKILLSLKCIKSLRMKIRGDELISLL